MGIKGILLLNLGTPKAPTVSAVRAYLKEFLSDPLVVDLPWFLRKSLLYGVILPFRPKQSSHAYQQIWTDEGSPLLVHSRKFQAELQDALGAEFQVELGMRYGEPKIAQAIEKFYKKGCHEVTVFPLFPQYSSAASGSAILAAMNCFKKHGDFFDVKVCTSFYDETYYYRPVAHIARSIARSFRPDFTLFSYHGLPERQLNQAGCDLKRCDREASCLKQEPDLELCYRAQCFKTTEIIAEELELSPTDHQTVFQSRLGKAVWVRPYLEEALPGLLDRGVKRLMVISPSFVVDCLETLEELGIRLRGQWLAMGGEAFELVPCLNADPVWVNAFAQMVKTASNFAQD